MRTTPVWIIALLAAAVQAAEAPSRFATLDGMRVHYRSHGAGTEAVVFIHGWTCDLTFWSGQAPFYEKRRSLLVDLPGHGLSDKPEVAYTQELFARAVEAAMRDAGVEKAVLVGHSMGTPVALTFLRNYPAKTAGLVIVDGFIRQPPKDAAEREKMQASGKAFASMYRTPDYRTPMTKMVEGMFSPLTSSEMRERIRSRMLSTPQHVVASAMEGMLTMRPLENETFQAPVLAVMARGKQGRPGYEAYLRTVFPNLRGYQEWEQVGHFLMMEQPEKFNAALEEFLSPHHQHPPRSAEEYARVLEDPKRDAWQKPHEVLEALSLRPGEAIADLGSGSGYFARRFARHAAKVYAVDIDRKLLDKVAAAKLPNLETILAAPDDPRLPAGALDTVFVCNVLHHIENRGSYYPKLARSLKPGGRIVIVDFYDKDLPVGPPRHMKLAEQAVVAELEAAGFGKARSFGFLPYQYFLVFARR